jgi:hypothetical protein
MALIKTNIIEVPTEHWFDNFRVLYENKNYVKFFPTQEMTQVEKLNAMARFSIYLFFLILIFGETHRNKYKWLYVPVLLLVFTIGVQKLEKIRNPDKKIREYTDDEKKILMIRDDLVEKNNVHESEYVDPETKKKYIKRQRCRRPTKNNPFMNVLWSDFLNDANRPSACNVDDEDINKELVDGFNENLFRSVNDVFENENSQRTYYSMPSTSIPNDRESYMDWLYKLPDTCKTDDGICIPKDEDLRQSARREFVIG